MMSISSKRRAGLDPPSAAKHHILRGTALIKAGQISARPHGIQIATPCELAAQAPDPLLLAQPQ
jgi:hypothetical protein